MGQLLGRARLSRVTARQFRTSKQRARFRTVHPFDAEGALKYLQSRGDVAPGQIFLQGWSNGASTALNVMYRQAALPSGGFRAAMALYPGCGPRALISQNYKVASPVAVFLASDDEEVSPAVCHR